MNTIFLLLSLAQADAAPRADAVQQQRPERVQQRPEAAPQDRGELARKTKKLEGGKKARRGKGQGAKGQAKGPKGHGAKGRSRSGPRRDGGDRRCD